MKKTVLLNKLYPNIDGLPIRISRHHAECFSEIGRKFCCMHMHNEIELLYIFQGDTTIELYNGTKFYACENDIVCINSNVPHITYATKECYIRHGLIQFNSEIFKNLGGSYNEVLSVIPKEPDTPVIVSKDEELRKICMNIFNQTEKTKVSRNLYAISGVYAILAYLYEINFISDDLNSVDVVKLQRLAPALQYILKEYSEYISLEKISATVNMSTYYFCRYFKEAFGVCFSDYIKLLRIKKAETSLIETDKSVLEIALENGFSSASYFNKVFKELKFCSPTEYRKFSKEYNKLVKLL